MNERPSNRIEELIRERARLDVELEQCKELVTVLFVDIVGSTRFYDQHGDIAGLVMVQKCLDLLIPLIEQHSGTVIKTIGDAILARFCEPEDAVRSAIDMQRNLDARNLNRAPTDQIHVRVAINLGLALLKGNDVFGDVVNVAARIESVTEADEISISPSVYEKIQHLPATRVRKRASGVELKGKLGKLDLYTVVWRLEETAGPTPPRPSKEQLFIATGLHTGLAELAQDAVTKSSSGKSGVVSQPSGGLDRTMAFGAQGVVEEPPKVGLRFAVARVSPDGGVGQRYRLDHPGMIAGRKAEIALGDDPLVAPQHVRFTQLGDGVYVEDLGSPQGVYLWLREPHRLKDGDIIRIGRQRLRFVVQGEALSAPESVTPEGTTLVFSASAASTASLVKLNSNEQETDRYELRRAETAFGRSKGVYTFPDDPYLSTTHAQIKFHDGQYILEDLGSTNGTFVRIRKRALARDKDTLLIGTQLLRLLAE